jgi:hypothetical protein
MAANGPCPFGLHRRHTVEINVRARSATRRHNVHGIVHLNDQFTGHDRDALLLLLEAHKGPPAVRFLASQDPKFLDVILDAEQGAVKAQKRKGGALRGVRLPLTAVEEFLRCLPGPVPMKRSLPALRRYPSRISSYASCFSRW